MILPLSRVALLEARGRRASWLFLTRRRLVSVAVHEFLWCPGKDHVLMFAQRVAITWERGVEVF
jgi:hypothetical protein